MNIDIEYEKLLLTKAIKDLESKHEAYRAIGDMEAWRRCGEIKGELIDNNIRLKYLLDLEERYELPNTKD